MRALLLATIALAAVPVAAEEEAPPSGTHLDLPSDIIVTAPYPREAFFVLSGVSVLADEELTRELRPTIGETLARLPGVSATYFGPNASRPVLRGLQGERVRVLTDGIGTFDVSNTSVDHAVVLNPFASDRVEVIRGPEVLLYGSSAIGGVVNSYDRRIPRGVPENGIHVDALGGFASAAREKTFAGSVDVAVAPNFVVHVDGSFLDTRDLRTGGFIYSRALREEALAEGLDPDEVNIRGRLDNTAARTWDVAGGATWFFGGDSSFGVSVTRTESRYGVPNRLEIDHHHDDHHHDHHHSHGTSLGALRPLSSGHGHHHHDHHHHHAHEDITLDMRQTRVDFRLDTALGDGFLERLRLRGGFADYIHDELDDDGDIETTFTSKGGEVRAELVQREQDGWKGASGFQFLRRTIASEGEEAYIPENRTNQFGIFTLQEYDLGGPKLEGALRYERTNVRSEFVGFDRGFNAVSVSAGGSVPLATGVRLGVSYTHAERAPAGEELLSDGPHFATQAFEVGDPDLSKERSDGVEGTLRARGDGWRANFAVYHTRFGNFIYLQPTDEIDDGLPVFLYTQDRARFTGIEFDSDVRLARWGATEIRGTFLADWVRASLSGGQPVPLIPPFRLLAGLEAASGPFGGRIEVEHTTAQERVAEFELPTDGWTMVNLSAFWKPWGADSRSLLMLSLNNVGNVEARRHASFIKDFAPLAGRDVRLTARVSF
ncbi:MAG: TonB-dependent receptor [Sphingomonadaceae bacterium]